MGFGERAARLLRRGWKHHQGRVSTYANYRALERNTVPTEQRERASGIPERAGIARIPAFQCGLSPNVAGAVSHSFPVSAGVAGEVPGRLVLFRSPPTWSF